MDLQQHDGPELTETDAIGAPSPIFEFGDTLGPHKVIHVQEPSIGLKGVLVIDNIAAGPSIGGLRMAPDVTVEECLRLARAMTLKNAAAGLPHGGGKSVLVGDPAMPAPEKETLIRAFASALRNETGYIFGPDMGTNEMCMGWVRDEIGRAVGLPRELGGIPLDEIGATGWGLFNAIDVACEFSDFDLEGARVVIQGFGAVGYHAARYLQEAGAVLIAAANSKGTIYNPDGLDPDALMVFKNSGRPIHEYNKAVTLPNEELLDLECEIWIPAARPDVITAENVDRLGAKMVAQGANIPVTPAADARLHERGILSLPDFIANSGGVICAAMEYAGATQANAFDTIAETIRNNTREMLTNATANTQVPRAAAMEMAEARVRRAMQTRRWSIF